MQPGKFPWKTAGLDWMATCACLVVNSWKGTTGLLLLLLDGFCVLLIAAMTFQAARHLQ